MARTTTTTLRRIRRLLLGGIVAFLAALVALYVLGRPRPAGLSPADREQAPEGKIVQVGRGFRYEVSEDGEKLFDIEADRVLSDESDLYVLEQVKITMEREPGSTYTMTAASGTYSILRNEASLTGDVEIRSTDGLTLKTEGLELRRRGQVVVSSAPVRLAMGELYFGRANRLEVLFPSNRILLAGKVEIGTQAGVSPTASLRAQRLVFFRDTHNLLAEGAVELRRGDDSLAARRLSVNFDELDRQVLFALANWDVVATLRQVDDAGLPSTATATGDQLSVVFDDVTGDAERLEIDAPEGGLARLVVVDATQLTREMEADYLWAEFAAGRLEQAQGLGGVAIEEGLAFAPRLLLRQVCSETAEALYDANGALVSLQLSGTVTYQERDLLAAGDELTALGDDGAVDLVGDRASIASSDGHLEAPRIHLDRAAGRAEATDGVRAELVRGSGPDLAAGAEEPVRIEAARADWTAEPREFRFQGDVRAWQEENFLVSESLGLAGEELVADGGVRSVWHRRTAAEEDADEPPVTVSAARMRYNIDEGRVVYEGSAQIVQGGRSMRCPRLQLEVGETDEFERMYCEGGSQIVDGDGGSNITGDAAIYNTDAGKVKVFGDPVRLSQPGGGTISARLVVYDFDTAIAEIDSVKDEYADLFMSSSEYFQQFGYTQFGSAVPPPAGGEATGGATDPVTGLPVAPLDPAAGAPLPGGEDGLPAPDAAAESAEGPSPGDGDAATPAPDPDAAAESAEGESLGDGDAAAPAPDPDGGAPAPATDADGGGEPAAGEGAGEESDAGDDADDEGDGGDDGGGDGDGDAGA